MSSITDIEVGGTKYPVGGGGTGGTKLYNHHFSSGRNSVNIISTSSVVRTALNDFFLDGALTAIYISMGVVYNIICGPTNGYIISDGIITPLAFTFTSDTVTPL